MIHLEKLDHPQFPHLLEKVSFDLAYRIHLNNDLGNGFSRLEGYRPNGLFDNRYIERAHTELFQPHPQKEHGAEWIAGHLAAHPDALAHLFAGFDR